MIQIQDEPPARIQAVLKENCKKFHAFPAEVAVW
jgi:hypothetical protein